MEGPGTVTVAAYWRLIRGNANFRKLWLAQVISEIGDWMYTVAIYSQLLDLTGGAAKSIGIAFTMQVLPQMLVSPMAGVLNDVMSRRTVMIISDIARAVIVALMLVAQRMELIWLIYVLLFLETVFWATFEPGRSAVIPNITSGEETLLANSLGSITWSFNFAVGFSIGGFMAAVFGKQTVFIFNSLSFLLSASIIARTRFREPHMEHLPPFRLRSLFDFSQVLDGIRYVRNDSKLFATLLVKTGLGFMGANWVLVTVLGERKFPISFQGLDPKAAGMMGMSILMGCRGLGALIGPGIGTFVAGHHPRRLRAGIAIGFLMSGVGYFLIGPANTIVLAGLCLVLAHSGGSIIWVFSTTLLQMNTEDKFRGRVFSAEFAFMTISMSVSSMLAGVFIDRGVEVGQVASWAGVIMLLPGLAWLFAQRLWRSERSHA
ncbi:MAG: MFS transporter [Candidatus Solibacter usitatus]|nr:MFS transporter [Candidatus Solibacter usitatus]